MSKQWLGGPSDRAYDAALESVPDATGVGAVLEAAHDPRLGLDRSVCLRDIVLKLREWAEVENDPNIGEIADDLEVRFGGGGT